MAWSWIAVYHLLLVPMIRLDDVFVDNRIGNVASITCLFPSIVRLADGVATRVGKVPLLGADFAIPAYGAFTCVDLVPA